MVYFETCSGFFRSFSEIPYFGLFRNLFEIPHSCFEMPCFGPFRDFFGIPRFCSEMSYFGLFRVLFGIPHSCSEMPHFGILRDLVRDSSFLLRNALLWSISRLVQVFFAPSLKYLISAYFEICSKVLILASKCPVLAYFETRSGFLIPALICLILAYSRLVHVSSFLLRNAS